jgi:hypothetical protein
MPECTVQIPIDAILITPNGARARVNPDTVEEYAAAMRRGAKFPPIVVFQPPDADVSKGPYYLADGWHRVRAAEQNGELSILATIFPGDETSAKWYAAGANQTHGLPRSNADKRAAVTLALRLKPELSDRGIAEHCGCSHPFVANVRAAIAAEDPAPTGNGYQLPESTEPATRIGRDGKERRLPQATPEQIFKDLEPVSNGTPVRDASNLYVPGSIPCVSFSVNTMGTSRTSPGSRVISSQPSRGASA